MSVHTYVAQDRLRALADGTGLPDRTTGSALLVDVSGFTAWTEALRQDLGTRHGAEQLTRRLSEVYSALISEVERGGGSVIGFAGDAMLCWFDGARGDGTRESGLRALGSAFGMQTAIGAFSDFGLKVAITSGPARRLVVGDPEVQRLDALAGETVARASTAERHAASGEVLVDEATAHASASALVVRGWRIDAGGERFAVVTAGPGAEARRAGEAEARARLPAPPTLRPWLHGAVFDRETSGSAFLTEFRPCVVVFVRFTGIDFDADTAGSDLDAFVRQVQRVATRYGGTLMDITIGDKGSYAHLNFGALEAHEDDARRAVKAARELPRRTPLTLQTGIAQGVLRVGAYGGLTRKTFGALGDEVNLAARLMTTATAGELLLSGPVRQAVAQDFVCEPRPPLPIKGKAEPLPVFAVTGESRKRAMRLQEPNYALPMVGRVDELQRVEEKLDLAAKGQGQVVAIVAEAGLGKSRLVAEIVRSARRRGFVGYGGACQSDALQTPYHVWKGIAGAFFDVDHEQPQRKRVRHLEREIEDRAPSRLDAMPLLNGMLDLNLPDNAFTLSLEPATRQSALHALLEDCLRSAAEDEPLLIVVEDMHWVDALSHELLERLAKALANSRVCFLLAYRPPRIARLEAPRLEALGHFTRIELRELTGAEATLAIRAKLAQLYPARGGGLPEGLAQTLMARAQGNPFYLEELLNYVRDRGLDPTDIGNLELPDTLHSLILSRIDQLSEQEKNTLRVASIVGRWFRARWLTGCYPALGAFPQVKAALDVLGALEITPLDSPEPELAYLFKHIVTHEVTYESLPFATRAKLHEQLAMYLEDQTAAEHAPPMLETLAFHYGRSSNAAKRREYLLKAAEAASGSFANDAALAHYGELLPLLEDARERSAIHVQRGEVLERIGRFDDADRDYRSALEMDPQDLAAQAAAWTALGRMNRRRGDNTRALEWLGRAREAHARLEDKLSLGLTQNETGAVLIRMGESARAHEALQQALALAREVGDRPGAARAMGNLGVVAQAQADYATARSLQEQSLSLRRELGGKAGIAASLIDLSKVAWAQGDFPTARVLLEESLGLAREMGDKPAIANALNNLGNVAGAQGDAAAAKDLYGQSLVLNREMGDAGGIAAALLNLGICALGDGDPTTARALLDECLDLCRQTSHTAGAAMALNILGAVALAQGDPAGARAIQQESLALCEAMGDQTGQAFALLGLGLAGLAEGRPSAREPILASLRLRVETGERAEQIASLVGVAGVAWLAGDAPQAARWLGAIGSALQALGSALDPEVSSVHDRTLAAVRTQLGEDACQAAWREGGGWSLEQAVRKALDG